jgi:acetyl esterase/lipase
MIDPSTAAMFDPAAVSAETRAFNRELAATLAELPKVHEVPPEVTRAARREGKGVFPLGGPLEGSSWAAIDPSGEGPGRVRLSQPKGPPRAIYVHIHGGGWTLGAPDQYDRHNQALAERTGMRVVSIQYRLAPEHPWPAQREDCLRALRWILSGTDRPLFMGGESAGAHLAAVCALDLRAIGGLDRLRGLVLNYGCFDLRMTPSVRNWGDHCLVLSTPIIAWFQGHTFPDSVLADPACSPLLADLRGMPPALLQVGTEDPLVDDTLFMAARWQAAGNRAELAVYPRGVHAIAMCDLELARQSHLRVADFLRRSLNA